MEINEKDITVVRLLHDLVLYGKERKYDSLALLSARDLYERMGYSLIKEEKSFPSKSKFDLNKQIEWCFILIDAINKRIESEEPISDEWKENLRLSLDGLVELAANNGR